MYHHPVSQLALSQALQQQRLAAAGPRRVRRLRARTETRQEPIPLRLPTRPTANRDQQRAS